MEPLLGYGAYSREGKTGRVIGSLLSIIGCILLLVAIATPELYHISLGDTQLYHIGPFLAKVLGWPANDSSATGTCKIDNSCQCVLSYDGINLPLQAADKCDTWQAGRSMLVIGLIIGLFGFLSQVTSFISTKLFLRQLGFSCPLVASIFGLIAMAIFAYEKDHDANFEEQDFGLVSSHVTLAYGFWVLVGGWISLGASAVCFNITKMRS